MRTPTKEEMHNAATALTRQLADSGNLIEIGFTAFRSLALATDAPPEEVRAARLAFFAGAEHLWGSAFNMLDGNTAEPTANDLRRLSLVAAELAQWRERMTLITGPAGGNS